MVRYIYAAVVTGILAAAQAQAGETPSILFNQICQIKNNGDIDIINDLTFSAYMYAQVKSTTVGSGRLLRDWGMVGAAEEVRIDRVDFDDSRNGLKISGSLLGAMRMQGEVWSFRIVNPQRYGAVDRHSDSIILAAMSHLDNGVMIGGTTRILFPAEVQDIRYNSDSGELLCRMPAPAFVAQAPANVETALKVRSEVMNCLGSSVYSSPRFSSLWVAKMIFQNKGPGPVRDFRVRFRLRNYTPWSEWKSSPIVYPTQTVVEAFYPLMDQKVCALSDNTPVILEVAWSYRQPEGQVVEKSDFRILTILGTNQVVRYGPLDPNGPKIIGAEDFAPVVSAAFFMFAEPGLRDSGTQFASPVAGKQPASSTGVVQVPELTPIPVCPPQSMPCLSPTATPAPPSPAPSPAPLQPG